MEEEERIVIDTNLLISAALNDKSASYEALSKAYENYTILQSNDTFDEFLEVIEREKFDKYLTNERKEEFLQDLTNESEFIPIDHETDACRDEKDNKFLELAVSGDAKYIVSGDRDLLDLGEYQNIEILSPSQFLEREKQRERELEPDRDNDDLNSAQDSADRRNQDANESKHNIEHAPPSVCQGS